MLPEIITDIPGPKSKTLAAELKLYESPNITFVSPEFPIFWERAQGCNVWDVDGNRYLDLTSAFGVSGLGHTCPEIVDAVTSQAERLVHAMGDVHPHSLKVQLCRRLSEITFERWEQGYGKVILTNSGSEAIEAALKTSALYSGKAGIISFTNSYHGLGHGALETTGLSYFRQPFENQLGKFGVHLPFPNCLHCPYDCNEAFRLIGSTFPNCSNTCLKNLEDQIRETIRQREIGAILVEPIQGRGGDVIPPRDFLPLLRYICNDTKTLLILDEIYTGFNRTGRLFACEHFDVIPDIICLGKGLTSGLPLAACIAREDIMNAWPVSTGEALHTSTFLGHPLGCAAALTSIKLHLDPTIQNQVRQSAKAWHDALAPLRNHPSISVRQIGLMIGIELPDQPDLTGTAAAIQCVNEGLREGLIFLTSGPRANVLSLSPIFEMTAEEIQFVGQKIKQLVGVKLLR